MGLTRGYTDEIKKLADNSLLGSAAGETLETTLGKLGQHIDMPLRLAATFPVADAFLRIDSNLVNAGDGAGKITPIISNTLGSFAAATINMQTGATTGGTVQLFNGSAFALPTSNASWYRRMCLSFYGSIVYAKFSPSAATLPGVDTAESVATTFSGLPGMHIGYVNLQRHATLDNHYKTADSATDIIEDSVGGTPTIIRMPIAAPPGMPIVTLNAYAAGVNGMVLLNGIHYVIDMDSYGSIGVVAPPGRVGGTFKLAVVNNLTSGAIVTVTPSGSDGFYYNGTPNQTTYPMYSLDSYTEWVWDDKTLNNWIIEKPGSGSGSGSGSPLDANFDETFLYYTRADFAVDTKTNFFGSVAGGATDSILGTGKVSFTSNTGVLKSLDLRGNQFKIDNPVVNTAQVRLLYNTGKVDIIPDIQMSIDNEASWISPGRSYYNFACSASATAGAIYSATSGSLYTVLETISGGTTLVCAGTGAPAATYSQVLTKVAGTGDATITVTALTSSSSYGTSPYMSGNFVVADFTFVPYYTFTCSTSVIAAVGDVYSSTNGTLFTVITSASSAGSGTLVCSGTGAPTAATSALTKISGFGSSSITYTGVATKADTTVLNGLKVKIQGSGTYTAYNAGSPPTWLTLPGTSELVGFAVDMVQDSTGAYGGDATRETRVISSGESTSGLITLTQVRFTPGAGQLHCNYQGHDFSAPTFIELGGGQVQFPINFIAAGATVYFWVAYGLVNTSNAPMTINNMMSANDTLGSVSVPAGYTLDKPYLNIPAGAVVSGAGAVSSDGVITGPGILATTGLLISRGVAPTQPRFNVIQEATATRGVAVQGRTDGGSSPGGYVGERISSVVPYAGKVTLINTTAVDITSIVLSPGDWDISILANIIGAPTGYTGAFSFPGTVVGNDQTGLNSGENDSQTTATPIVSTGVTMVVPAFRVNITVTTRYYLKIYSGFTGGTLYGYGRISAVRAA